MNALTENQMEGMTGEQQAKKAIRHVLEQIKDNPEIGWYLGEGTQSFSLLTEAAATLFERPTEEVRGHFRPKNPRDPRRRDG